MGKLRELWYGAPEDFEWSVNHELKKIAVERISAG